MSKIKKNTVYSFDISFIAVATNRMMTSPTLAAGDVLVKLDDGNFANITTLPTVSANNSYVYKVGLSADETNATNKVTVLLRDASGNEWLEQLYCFDVEENTLDDVVVDGIDANIISIDGDTEAASNLRISSLSIVSGAIVSGTNTTTSFKTNLTSSVDDFYGDADGGSVCVFTTGALKGQGIRVNGFNGTTKYITVESAYTGVPQVGDEFMMIGRIEVAS